MYKNDDDLNWKWGVAIIGTALFIGLAIVGLSRLHVDAFINSFA